MNYLDHKTKEKIKNGLLILLIITLVSSFILFFLGFYKVGLVVGGIFMFLATVLGQWSSHKTADYLYRNNHNNNRRRK